MGKTHDEDEIEIDLRELFFALKKRILIILAALVAGAVIAGAYTKLLITPVYSATSTMLVLTKETTLASLADLQIGSQLTGDYSILITSRTVLEDVIDELGLDMDYRTLRANVSINNPSDTRILELTVTNSDPQMAKKIVDTLAKVSSEFIGDQMEIVGPKIIEEGEVPAAQTSPSLKKNVMVGALAGFVLAAGVVVLMTILNDTIKSEDDIEKYLGIPTLANIPDRKDYISGKDFKEEEKKEEKEAGKMAEQKVIMNDPRKPDYFYEESIKTLRTNIQFTGMEVKTIAFTSCYPNEGKSDVTFQLAMEIGKMGKRVLVIDADIRKSTFITRYGVKQKVEGLSQFLSGQTGGDNIIYQTNFENVDMIFAGPVAPNPSELLEQEAFSLLVRTARDRYDYVLIDTPPIGSMIDAAIVAKQCDGAVLVIESELVSYRIAVKAKEQLEMSGCRILGAVLNKVDTKKDKYYSKYNYYYNYSSSDKK